PSRPSSSRPRGPGLRDLRDRLGASVAEADVLEDRAHVLGEGLELRAVAGPADRAVLVERHAQGAVVLALLGHDEAARQAPAGALVDADGRPDGGATDLLRALHDVVCDAHSADL